MSKPRLLFISPRYLLPADMGGKIRTAHVLKGLKGGAFHITLLSPAPAEIPAKERAELDRLCDAFCSWPEPETGPFSRYWRLRHVFHAAPISVASDWSRDAARKVLACVERCDIVVADFPHTAIFLPQKLNRPSVLFTHNVEAEIFARHLGLAKGGVMRALWQDQLKKMKAFESRVLRRFDRVIAVSERDRNAFQTQYGITAAAIPTGVDLDYFSYHAPEIRAPVAAFTASMDSLANIDGVRWLMDEVWPHIASRSPAAKMHIIGRKPDPSLVAEARRRALPFHFTGAVEDVRPHLEQASLYVIPLRAGGGTRIKAFEAMAFGLPVVSTAIGVEGLGVVADQHYLQACSAKDFAGAMLALFADPALGLGLSRSARRLVEEQYPASRIGRIFEAVCLDALRCVSASPARKPEPGMSAA